MLYRIIVTYLIAIIVEVFLNPDFYLSLTLFAVSLIFLYKEYFYKGHNKIIKDMSFIIILFTTFAVGTEYTSIRMVEVSYKSSSSNEQTVLGKVVSLNIKPSGKEIVVQEAEGPNRLVSTNVSSLNEVERYDLVEFTGVVKPKSYTTFLETKPIILSHEYENIFYSTPNVVSFPKNFQVKSNDKTFTETFYNELNKTSETVFESINNYMPSPYSDVASAISTGNQVGLTNDIKDMFRNSGLIHIMVLSGANISFIISIIWYLFKNFKTRTRTLSALILSWIFIISTGLHPPSIRAGVMSSFGILAEYLGKNFNIWNSLLISIFVLTLLNPLTLVYSASLHLSYIAVLGIFILAPKVELFLKRRVRFFERYKFINFIFSTSISVSLSTTPYLLSLTGSSSISGSLLTIILEPIIFVVTVLSLLIIVLGITSKLLYFDLLTTYSDQIIFFLGSMNTLFVKIILGVSEFGSTYIAPIVFNLPVTFVATYYILFVYFCYRISKSDSLI